MDQQRAVSGTVRTVPKRTLVVARPPSWTEQGACVGKWEQYDSQEGARIGSRRAAAMCADCPVRAQCLEDALEAEGDLRALFRDGIRGGLTPMDRTKLSRLIKLADTGLCPCGRHVYDEDRIRWDNDRPLCGYVERAA